MYHVYMKVYFWSCICSSSQCQSSFYLIKNKVETQNEVKFVFFVGHHVMFANKEGRCKHPILHSHNLNSHLHIKESKKMKNNMPKKTENHEKYKLRKLRKVQK